MAHPIYLLVASNTGTNNPLLYRIPKGMRQAVQPITVHQARAKKHLLSGKHNGFIVSTWEGVQFIHEMGGTLSNTKKGMDDLLGAACVLQGKPVVVVPAEHHLRHSRVAVFMYLRLLQRWTAPDSYMRPEFLDHQHLNPNQRHLLEAAIYENPVFVAVDIETLKGVRTRNPETDEPIFFGAVISLMSYTFTYMDGKEPRFQTFTHVLNCEQDFEMADLVMKSKVPKVMHNGMYDSAYMIRWNITPRDYLWDTMYWMRSVTPFLRYSTDKAFYSLFHTAGFYLFENDYWKEDRTKGDWNAFIKYGATDTMRTAMIAFKQMQMVRQETYTNYVIRMAPVPACILSEMRGLLIDTEQRAQLRHDFTKKRDGLVAQFQAITGFTPEARGVAQITTGAYKFFKDHLPISDMREVTSADKLDIQEVQRYDPLMEHIFEICRSAKRTSKWLSTYINATTWSDMYNGGGSSDRETFLYSLSPFGTVSGRFSSAKSPFWVGGSGQTLPSELRSMFKAPDGYSFISSDTPQAESRTTAVAARNAVLWDAVSGDDDFHSANAAAFFGIPYEEIYDNATGKKLNKDLRELAKRVGHGANYNMRAYMLLLTMGIAAVRYVQKVMGLPPKWSATDVTKFLLKKFDERYVGLRTTWYKSQVLKVITTGRLKTLTGYAPLFLGNPLDITADLNTIASLEPQHISAKLSIDTFMRLAACELQGLPVRCVLQVHDEVLGYAEKGIPLTKLDELFSRLGVNPLPTGWDKVPVLNLPVGLIVAGATWAAVSGDPIGKNRHELTT